jgi:hypothetical protein
MCTNKKRESMLFGKGTNATRRSFIYEQVVFLQQDHLSISFVNQKYDQGDNVKDQSHLYYFEHK